MAPKTHGASSSGAGLKRKRTVRRPVREPSSDSSSTSSPSGSPVPATTLQVDHFASRVVTTGRKVDFELFENEGFIIGRQLIEMGLEKMCSLDCPTYPALVKEFYKNLTRGDNGLVSVVRGIGLNITATILSRLLNLPLSGPSTFAPEDRSPALTRLLNRNFEGFEEVLASQLPLELRLLHNICSRVLFPKTGRFDYVSERDIFIMDAVVSGKPINLPTMMIWYMADCGSKKKSSLPYGMVLTKLFQSQGIAFSDSEPKKELRHTDFYSLATINRMGFVKRNGSWERKNIAEDRALEAEAPRPSVRHSSPEPPQSSSIPDSVPAPAYVPDSTPAPAPAQTSTLSSVSFSDVQLDQLRSLFKSEISEHENRLKNEFDEKFMNLKEALYSLSDRVASIESTLSSSTSSLSEDLKNIFEELKDICGDGETYARSNAELQDKISKACTFVDEKLKDYVKVQCEGMQKIVEHLNRITRRNF